MGPSPPEDPDGSKTHNRNSPTGDDTVFEFIRRIGTEADAELTRVADETDIRDAVGVLVQLGSVTRELSRDEFYAVFDRDDAELFGGSIEAYGLSQQIDDATPGDVVLRVTFPDGDVTDYRGQASDLAFFLGKGIREGWAVAHLDETLDAFDDQAMRYIRPRYLFNDNGMNRSDALRRDDNVLQTLTGETFQQALDALLTLPEDERDRVLEEIREGSDKDSAPNGSRE